MLFNVKFFLSSALAFFAIAAAAAAQPPAIENRQGE
jgi:hypothetical protein